MADSFVIIIAFADRLCWFFDMMFLNSSTNGHISDFQEGVWQCLWDGRSEAGDYDHQGEPVITTSALSPLVIR